MLLFVDESGSDLQEMPCEVLAGVAIPERNLWNLVKAIRSAERDCFGGYLRDVRRTETKAKFLLKRKRFRLASQRIDIPEAEWPELASTALRKGAEAHEQGKADSGVTARELTGYSRAVLKFVHQVLDVAAAHDAKVFASIVDADAARVDRDLLRKDAVYLFERYFYYLETLPSDERGLVVFDELEKAKAHQLVQRMAKYFLGTDTGQFRSSRIVPEPFFVHSDLTTGVFLADLAAYILGWGWRMGKMKQPAREELKPYVQKLHDMQFHGEKPRDGMDGTWVLHSIRYLDDLRGRMDRPAEG
jgi:hypothetical protein